MVQESCMPRKRPASHELTKHPKRKWPSVYKQIGVPEDSRVLKDILSILAFTTPEIDRYLSLPSLSHIDTNGRETKVPAAYVRTRCWRRFMRTWMNRTEATHNLFVRDPTTTGDLLYPIHEVIPPPQEHRIVLNGQMVLLSQCGSWQEILTNEVDQIPGLPPTLCLTVPSSAEFDALLYFLHDHDEQHLYESLLDRWDEGSLVGERNLRNFAMNVRHLGVIDARIRGVLRAVLEAEI